VVVVRDNKPITWWQHAYSFKLINAENSFIFSVLGYQ